MSRTRATSTTPVLINLHKRLGPLPLTSLLSIPPSLEQTEVRLRLEEAGAEEFERQVPDTGSGLEVGTY